MIKFHRHRCECFVIPSAEILRPLAVPRTLLTCPRHGRVSPTRHRGCLWEAQSLRAGVDAARAQDDRADFGCENSLSRLGHGATNPTQHDESRAYAPFVSGYLYLTLASRAPTCSFSL